MGESWERGYQKVTTCLCVCLLCCVSASGPVFNRSNVLRAVEGVGDWWSEGDYRCRGGGLGYWLAVSKAKGEEILELHRDEPVKQREALIAFWFAVNRFLTWERVCRAVQHVGHTGLASLISTYGQPPTGTYTTSDNNCY